MESKGHWIKSLEIRNFKSIRKLSFQPKKVNLFIGRPNVGKSNIIEAISLLAAGFDSSDICLDSIIRYSSPNNLFHFGDIQEPILVTANNLSAKIRHLKGTGSYDIIIHENPSVFDKFEDVYGNIRSPNPREVSGVLGENELDSLSLKKPTRWYYRNFDDNKNIHAGYYPFSFSSNVKPYSFNKEILKTNEYKNQFTGYLNVPFGSNLFAIIQTNRQLQKDIADYFEPYGIEFILDMIDKKFELQKKQDNIVYKIPFYLIADTIQRLIFYHTAISSNENSVLLFEEPENHSYPPYVQQLANEIISDNTNQFFIATHSPYLIQKIAQSSDPDYTGIYIVDLDNNETTIKEYSGESLKNIVDYGFDIFFNI